VQTLIRAILSVVALMPVKFQAMLLPLLDEMWGELDGLIKENERQEETIEAHLQALKFAGEDLERDKERLNAGNDLYLSACEEINRLNVTVKAQEERIAHQEAVENQAVDELDEKQATINKLIMERGKTNATVEENVQLRKTNAHYANKLHQEEVTCSKAIDDLAKLAGLLLSDEVAFEKQVAAAAIKGPCPRASRMVKVTWDNDPSGIMCHEARPSKIMDYIKECCQKHNK